MARRIEIELTSARPDGTWTWRAAGAREPKGVLDGELLYEGARTGDVAKADAEFELEGIVITSVAAPRQERRKEPERIEVVGSGRPDGPGVTTQLVGRGERRDHRREDDRRGDRSRGPRPDPAASPGREDRPGRRGERPGRDERPARPGERAPRDANRPPRDGERAAGRDRDLSPRGRGRTAESTPNQPRRDSERTAAGPRPNDPSRRDSPTNRSGRSQRDRHAPDEQATGSAERGRKRLSPASTHRRAVVDSLPPEQRPVAEQLLRGGLPAVRTALHLEREKAETEGRPAPNTDALLSLAESILPRLRAAEWRDRAEAAVAGLDDISLRDLRSIAAGADLARDDETRELAGRLRQAIESRVSRLHAEWEADIAAQLDAHRPVRAVRLSSRPPDATARLGDDLAARLVAAAGATLGPDTPTELWAAMLEAVAESPIRRSVVPVGLPVDAPPELKRAAHQYSGSIPALAKLLGVTIPPPPVPPRSRRHSDRQLPKPAVSAPRSPTQPGQDRSTPDEHTPPARTSQTEPMPEDGAAPGSPVEIAPEAAPEAASPEAASASPAEAEPEAAPEAASPEAASASPPEAAPGSPAEMAPEAAPEAAP